MVSIDWNKMPRGHAVPGTVTITMTGAGADIERTVRLRAFHPPDLDLAALPDAVEDNGVVAIEAENFVERHDRTDGTGWRKVDKATASGDGMTIQPVTAPASIL